MRCLLIYYLFARRRALCPRYILLLTRAFASPLPPSLCIVGSSAEKASHASAPRATMEKEVFVQLNRRASNGADSKVILVRPGDNMVKLKKLAGKVLGIRVRKVFLPSGAEIESVDEVQNHDVLLVSSGEPFHRVTSKRRAAVVGMCMRAAIGLSSFWPLGGPSCESVLRGGDGIGGYAAVAGGWFRGHAAAAVRSCEARPEWVPCTAGRVRVAVR